MKITRKALIPIIFAILLVGIVRAIFDYATSKPQAEQQETEQLALLSQVFTGRLDSLEEFAVGMAMEWANTPEVQAAFAAYDRERLIELTLPAYLKVNEAFDVPQAQFHLPPATSFLRLHQLDKFDDDLSSFRFTVIDANIHKVPVGGTEIGRGGLGMRGVVPVEYQGRHIGTVEVGLNIDQTLIDSLKQQFNTDWQILLSRGPAEIATFEGTTSEIQGPTADLLLQASTLAEPFFATQEAYQKALNGEPQVTRMQSTGISYAVYSTPLVDFRGQTIGVLDIIYDRTVLVQQQNRRNMMSVGSILMSVLFTASTVGWVLTRSLKPIGSLTEAARAISSGDLKRTVIVKGKDELAILAGAFNSMTTQLRNLVGSLEQRVSERMRDVQLAAEVSQSISQVKDLDVLLSEAVEMIRSHFKLYYVQVYLVDIGGRSLVLRAGTGPVGQQLLRRGHRLALDAASINGKAGVEKRPVLVADTTSSGVHRPNPLLPDTRSEAAVPLVVGEKVLGVLDLQADQPDTFQTENLFAFQALANQLAIALQNATLFEQAEQARFEVEAQMRRQTRKGWQEFLDAVQRSEHTGFAFDQTGMTVLEDPLPEAAAPEEMEVPITVAGEPVGRFRIEQEAAWDKEDKELVEQVARQVGEQIQSLRLLAQAEQYRQEAENVVQRLTREGWQSYQQSAGDDQLGYVYDQQMVSPLASGSNGYHERASLLPLQVRGEQIGEIGVVSQSELAKDDQDVMDAIAQQLSTHLENLRLLEETRRAEDALTNRAADLAKVAELATQVTTQTEVYEILQSLVDQAKESFGLYHAHIYLLDSEGDHLELAAGAGEVGRKMVAAGWQISASSEKSLVARAARTRQAVIANDVRADPDFLANELLPNTRAEMAVPLVVGSRVLGVLDVQSEQVDHFTPEDASIQTTLASQVAVALQNAQQFRETQVALTQAETLFAITSAATRSLELSDILGETLTRILAATGYEAGLVSMLDETTGKLYLAVHHNLPEPLQKWLSTQGLQGTLCQLVFDEGRAITLNDLSAGAPVDVSGLLKMGFHSYQGAPVQAKGKTLGTICVFGSSVRPGSDTNTTLFQAAGQQIGIAIENTRLFQETQAALAQSETLYAIARAAAQSLNLDEILHEMLAQVLKATRLDAGLISMVDPTTGRLYIAVQSNLPQPLYNKLTTQGLEGTLCDLVYKRQEAMNVEDLQIDSPVDATGLLALGLRAYQGVPLESRGQVVGTLCAFAREPRKDLKQTVNLMEIAGKQVGVAIENAQLFQQTQQQAEREAAINTISQRIQATTSVEEALQVAVRELGRTLGAQRATIQLGVPQREPQKMHASNGGNGSTGGNGVGKNGR